MAIWVNVARAAKFPEVIKVYGRAGWGQGSGQAHAGATTPPQAKRGFLTDIRKRVSMSAGAALPAWIRYAPGASNGWQNVQVDVTAIDGVRPLRVNGKWSGF